MTISFGRSFALFASAGLVFAQFGCESDSPPSSGPTAKIIENRPVEQPVAPPQPVASPQPVVPPEGYSITVDATAQGSAVELAIKTNIWGVIEVMAGVDLKGQAADDVYIGKHDRVRIIDGTASVSIDVSDLPTGEYEATVGFYPRWGFQDEVSRSTGITDELRASQDISFEGSGESASETQFRKSSQKWVMGNVVQGTAWRESVWKDRFGGFEELPVERYNPQIIHAYYFTRIDMTIFVNTRKGTISHFRKGRANQ